MKPLTDWELLPATVLHATGDYIALPIISPVLKRVITKLHMVSTY